MPNKVKKFVLWSSICSSASMADLAVTLAFVSAEEMHDASYYSSGETALKDFIEAVKKNLPAITDCEEDEADVVLDKKTLFEDLKKICEIKATVIMSRWVPYGELWNEAIKYLEKIFYVLLDISEKKEK